MCHEYLDNRTETQVLLLIVSFCCPRRYIGLDESLRVVREAVERDGPYDGILGFSQGATLAALFCLLAAPTAASPAPFRCAILVAGFLPKDTSSLSQIEARAAFHPPLRLPILRCGGQKAHAHTRARVRTYYIEYIYIIYTYIYIYIGLTRLFDCWITCVWPRKYFVSIVGARSAQ